MTNKIFYFLSLIIVLFIIIYTQILQASYDVINHDDLSVMFKFTENFFENYVVNAYHGRFITNIFATLTCSVLPLSLDLHPNYWMQTFGAGIKAIFIFIICHLLSTSLFLFDKTVNKYKKFLIPVFILLFYFLYQDRFNGHFQSFLYMSFYGFTFPFIIFFFFWKKFIKYFCCDNDEVFVDRNYKRIIFFCLLSFLVGCSSEFFWFSSFGTFTLLLIYLIGNKHKNILIYICMYASLIVGLLMYVLNLGFQGSAYGKKYPSYISLAEFKAWIMEVFNDLSAAFFSDFIYIIIAIIILFIILFFVKIENKNKKTLILFYFILSVLFFYLSMSNVRSNWPEQGFLYIIHFDIITQVQIAFIFVITLQISFLSEYKYLKNILIFTLFICMLYLTKQNLVDTCNLIVKNDKNNYVAKYCNNPLDDVLKKYKCEYILLEYIKDGKIIYYNVNSDLRPYEHLSFDYITTTYNINYEINQQKLNIATVEQLYETFLNEGGEPLSQEELDAHDFNVLLHRYRKK